MSGIALLAVAAYPDAADRLADCVVAVMHGLSTMARQGYGFDRISGTAALAGTVIERALRA